MKKQPKAFVKESYNRSNDWGINKIKEYLISAGYKIQEKEKEDYKVDITAEKNGKDHYFEVETKTGYPFTGKSDFKFETVSFLARKKKWADIGFWYIIVCKETNAFVMCNSQVIYQEKHLTQLEIDSAERKGTDYFYRVPKKDCHWYKI